MFKKKEKGGKREAKAPQSSRKADQPARRGEREFDYSVEGKIRARIIDVQNGLRVVTGVYGIRIQSRDYSLLIMEDYLPTLGKVDGKVTMLTGEEEIALQGIRGFYKHQHNEFTILIEDRAPEAAAPQEG